MISKETLLKALEYFSDIDGETLIEDSKLKIRQGNYEYIFAADSVKYIGDGSEFLTLSFADEWTSHGTPQLSDGALTLDGASWLSNDAISLGGQDFQIVGRVFEDADDMIARRKIFELYSASALNISLYSSGAGKNLDLLINCAGTFDNYSEPALLEEQYTFALKWRQSTNTLTLDINGTQIYSLTVAGLSERRTFEQVLIGASVLHSNATWRGTISNFEIYDGFAEV